MQQHAIDATVAETALRESGNVAILTSDVAVSAS
jgi:hypothetical protein